MAQVSPIPTLNATMSILASYTASGSVGLLGNNQTPQINAGVAQNFQNITATTGILNASQSKYFSTTIAASGTTTLDYSAASNNLLSSSTATFGTGLTGLFWFLPTVAQAAVLGITVQATGVTIGNTGATQFLGFFGSAVSLVSLVPGDIVGGIRSGPAASAWTISGAAKSLLLTNLDVANAATVITFMIGV